MGLTTSIARTQRNVLYRFIDSSGRLLYVGITMNPPQRFKAHQGDKDWWAEVSEIKIQTFDTRDLLVQAEKDAIVAEKPLYNVVHNGRAEKNLVADSDNSGEFQPKHPLVGKWFHTTTKCLCGATRPVWQGQILSSPSTDVLLVQLYEWLMGEPSGQELISLDDFMSRRPLLYDSDKDMRYSTEYGNLRHRWGSDCDGNF